ncbi:MAG: dTDP-4-dehydrorhamnose reductase [Mycobacteriales bacterium]
MTRLLVVGAGGQLGSDLLRWAPGARGLARADLDVRDGAAVRAAVGSATSGGDLVVVNCAAYTGVDAAEADVAEAHAVNAVAPGLLASACADAGARLVHVSTDYVFPGDATRPYEVSDPVGPRSVYGQSKLAGELAALAAHPEGTWVVRTAWLYGARGANFVKTIARLERERTTLEVVDDQRGCPTWSSDLAVALLALVAAPPSPGVYHATNTGDTTWCGLARAVFEELGADPARVRPVGTAAVPRPAPRPAYGVLSDRAWRSAGLPALRPWRAALSAAFSEVGEALHGTG